jgi:hypothetical protein
MTDILFLSFVVTATEVFALLMVQPPDGSGAPVTSIIALAMATLAGIMAGLVAALLIVRQVLKEEKMRNDR